MPIDSHLPQADPFSLVPTFKVAALKVLTNEKRGGLKKVVAFDRSAFKLALTPVGDL
jgi:hypothetical protein